MSAIVQLSQKSSQLLSSGNTIASVFSVVKELLENSLDAGATNVEVKLENFGLDKIEVRDNGVGICKADVESMAKASSTSKISSFSDLDTLETYGFRGEALNAICTMSDMSITTKTDDDEISMMYYFDKSGDIKSRKPSAASTGTCVIVCNLFDNIPVRKKYCKANKNKQGELKKVEDLLCAFSCAHLATRFVLHHNRNVVWSKTSALDMKAALIQVLGFSVVKCLDYKKREFPENVVMEGFFPKQSAPLALVTRTCSDRTIVLVNKRPVKIKPIEKLLQKTFCKSDDANVDLRGRFPICSLSISMAPSQLDVNVDPSKLQVLLHNSDNILSLISEFLNDMPVDQGMALTEPNEAFFSLQSQGVRTPLQEKAKSKKCSQTSNVFKSREKVLTPHGSSKTADVHPDLQLLFEKNIVQSQLPCPSSMRNKNVTLRQATNLSVFSSPVPKQQQQQRSGLVTTAPVQPNISSATITLQVEKQSDLLRQPSFADAVAKQNNPNNSLSGLGSFLSGENNVVRGPFNENSMLLSKAPEKEQRSGQLMSNGSRQPVSEEKQLHSEPVTVLVLTKKMRMDTDAGEMSKSSKPKSKLNVGTLLNKPLSAFDVYCRQKRLEVVAENPKLSNQDVAVILFEKWKLMPNEEKQKYSAAALSKNSKQEKVRMLPKCIKNHEQVVDMDINKLRQYHSSKQTSMDQESLDRMSVEGEFTPVGALSSGIWMFSENNQLGVLSTYRMQEMLLFQRLLETYQLKAESLPNPILLTPDNLGDAQAYETLILLCMKDGDADISNVNLTSNGFGIRFSRGDCVAQLVGLNSTVHGYGVPDLGEVLRMLKANEEMMLPMAQCRPFKLVQYLQGEAVRIARQALTIQKQEELFDLLRQSHRYLENCTMCFHNKPFKHHLLDLDDLS